MMQIVGNSLREVCWCLKIGPLLVLLFLTNAEPICIEELLGPVSITNHFSKMMGVTVIGLLPA